MQYELIPVYLLAAAFVAEKALVLYRRVMADGKVTLDEVMEIVEEAEEAHTGERSPLCVTRRASGLRRRYAVELLPRRRRESEPFGVGGALEEALGPRGGEVRPLHPNS